MNPSKEIVFQAVKQISESMVPLEFTFGDVEALTEEVLSNLKKLKYMFTELDIDSREDFEMCFRRH